MDYGLSLIDLIIVNRFHQSYFYCCIIPHCSFGWGRRANDRSPLVEPPAHAGGTRGASPNEGTEENLRCWVKGQACPLLRVQGDNFPCRGAGAAPMCRVMGKALPMPWVLRGAKALKAGFRDAIPTHTLLAMYKCALRAFCLLHLLLLRVPNTQLFCTPFIDILPYTFAISAWSCYGAVGRKNEGRNGSF